MSQQQRFVDIARREVGTLEVGGNNRGPRIREYQEATWLAPDSWPWCAAFCCWVLREWLQDGALQVQLGLMTPAAVNKWLCRDARAFGWEDWARKRGLQVLPETAPAMVGDLIIFDFSHIGIVARGGRQGERLVTIEGNTGPDGGRDGDGVYEKRRLHSPATVRSFVRILQA